MEWSYRGSAAAIYAKYGQSGHVLSVTSKAGICREFCPPSDNDPQELLGLHRHINLMRPDNFYHRLRPLAALVVLWHHRTLVNVVPR